MDFRFGLILLQFSKKYIQLFKKSINSTIYIKNIDPATNVQTLHKDVLSLSYENEHRLSLGNIVKVTKV